MDIQYEQVEKKSINDIFFFFAVKVDTFFFSENLVSRYGPIFVTYSNTPKIPQKYPKNPKITQENLASPTHPNHPQTLPADFLG